MLAAGYVLRAIGDSVDDTGPRWLSWLSPTGWAEEVQAFAANRWWVLALMLVVAIALAGVAAVLNQRRDFGASMFAVRPGPAAARPSLRNSWSLAIRLQRGALLGWLVGFLVLGGVYGAISGGIAELLASSPQMTQIIQQLGGTDALTDAYFAGVLGIIAVVAAAYGISAMLRLRTEETSGRVESVLATPTRRTTVFGSHLSFALLGPAALLLGAGLTMGIAANAALADGGSHLGPILAGALVQVPAVWVVTGVAALLVGVAPRFTSAAWGVLAVVMLIGQLGPVLQLPQWVMDVSPFNHVPKLPGGTVELAAAGRPDRPGSRAEDCRGEGFRRRDIG